MEIITAIQANLLSPAVLFFVLGLIAALTKSDLKFPEPLYVGLTIYLLIAIGFKGGVAISEAGLARVWLPALAAMLLGAVIPLWTYPLLRFGGKLPAVDAAAIAAHYGSVSAVTFIAATNYLEAIGQPFESYATAFLAVMESPAILVGVVLGKLATRKAGVASAASLRTAVHEAVFGRSIFLLVGALVVGALCGAPGMKKVEAFFVTPFQGVLALFSWRWASWPAGASGIAARSASSARTASTRSPCAAAVVSCASLSTNTLTSPRNAVSDPASGSDVVLTVSAGSVIRIVLAGVGVERSEHGRGLQMCEQNVVEDVVEHGVFLRLDDEHDHRELRVVGDAGDAVVRRLKFNARAEFRAVCAQLGAEHFHRAIAFCLESAKTEILTQRVVGDECVERSPLPDNLLARGGENLSERGGFFIVLGYAPSGVVNQLIPVMH